MDNLFSFYQPAFMDGELPAPLAFTGIGELMLHPKFQSWINDPKFLYFAQSKYVNNYIVLAVLQDTHWVIGFTDYPTDLPIWTASEPHRHG